MSTISKTLLAVLVGVLVGGATLVMASPGGKSSPKSMAPAAATTTTPTADVKGPCDEAEHANDPRCAGPQQPEDRPNHDRNQADDNQVADDDGPLHEIGDDNPGEHHSNRGPGSLNSGPGNATSDDGPNHDVGDDHGGNGSDDTGFDDHGGSSHSGSDDSGSGHSGSDD
jgi:hypothetical protein